MKINTLILLGVALAGTATAAGPPPSMPYCDTPLATVAIAHRNFIRQSDGEFTYRNPEILLGKIMTASHCLKWVQPGTAADYIMEEGYLDWGSLALRSPGGTKQEFVSAIDDAQTENFPWGEVFDITNATPEQIHVGMRAFAFDEYRDRARGREIAANYLAQIKALVEQLRIHQAAKNR